MSAASPELPLDSVAEYRARRDEKLAAARRARLDSRRRALVADAVGWHRMVLLALALLRRGQQA